MQRARLKRSATLKLNKSLLASTSKSETLLVDDKLSQQDKREQVMVFGKPPAKSVEVKFRRDSDPTKMLTYKGMDEYMFKVKMINYGNQKPVQHYLHQAVLGDSK